MMRPLRSFSSDSDETETTKKEDDNIHPKELSGDENDQKKLFTQYHPRKANLLMTSTLVSKTAFGAGIISLPYTIGKLGYVLSAILFILFLVLNQFSVTLLLKSKNLSRHSNYSTIMYYLWRTKAAAVLGSFIIFIENFGNCIVLLVLLKENLLKISTNIWYNGGENNSFLLSPAFIISVMGVCISPFAFVKKIQKLKVFSFIGMSGIIAFVVGVIAKWTDKKISGYQFRQLNAFPQDNFLKTGAVLVNIAYAYSFQVNFFPIFKGLKKPTDQRMSRASFFGLLQCLIPYTLVGYMGYYLLDTPNQQNFLMAVNYPAQNEVAHQKIIYFAMHISFFISSFVAIILYFFSSRNNFINIINILRKKLDQKREQESSYFGDEDRLRKKINKQYFFFTTLLLIVLIIGAIWLPQGQLLYNILGAVSETIYSLILPCLFYVLLVRRRDRPKYNSYYLSIALMIVIVPFSLFSTVSIIASP